MKIPLDSLRVVCHMFGIGANGALDGETVMHPMLEFGLIMLQYGLYVVGFGLALGAVYIMVKERM